MTHLMQEPEVLQPGVEVGARSSRRQSRVPPSRPRGQEAARRPRARFGGPYKALLSHLQHLARATEFLCTEQLAVKFSCIFRVLANHTTRGGSSLAVPTELSTACCKRDSSEYLDLY